MAKRELGPLIPLDDLKQVVRGLVAVPKHGVEPKKVVKPRPKSPRRDKQSRPKRGRNR